MSEPIALYAFQQPLLQRLVKYVGVSQTLYYASTCRSHALARKWLIEHCALVDHRIINGLHERGIEPKYVSAIANTLDDLRALSATVTQLTFGDSFNESLDDATLPPSLTHLKFGHRFNQPLDNVTLPPTLTHLTFDEGFSQCLDNLDLPKHLTHLDLGYWAHSRDDIHLPGSLRVLKVPFCVEFDAQEVAELCDVFVRFETSSLWDEWDLITRMNWSIQKGFE